MADRLVIHGADLQEAYSRIVYLHGEFDSATARSDDAASYVGHPGLKSELENVAGSWRIHREKLLKSLEDIESQIKGTLDTFGDVDKKMAENLHSEGAPSGQSGTSGGTAQEAPTGGAQSHTSGTGTPPVAAQPSQASPLAVETVQTTPRQAAVVDTVSTDSGTTSIGASTTQGIDSSAYPPELRSLVSKLSTLVTSPDFIAKYPQFAAGAGLGALLPLLLAGAAASSATSGGLGSSATGGRQSATDTVRGLLGGVKKDMSDGHLDTMTAAQARAELDRLLGPDNGAPTPDGAGGSVAPDQSTTAPEAAHADTPVGPSPAEAPKSETGGGSSSSTSGGASSPAADFRAGSPMLNENPDTVGQVPTSNPSGPEAAVAATPDSALSAAPHEGGVSGNGSSSFASGDQPSLSAAQPGPAAQTGTTGQPSEATSHIATPMMSTGSLGSTGTSGTSGSTAASGTTGQTSSAPASSAGSTASSGTSSSRQNSDKDADSRKSAATDETRTEGKS
jgi:hypothetical protein